MQQRTRATVCVVTLLYAMGYVICGPSVGIITKRLALDQSSAGFAMNYGIVSSCYPIFKTVGAPLIGHLSGTVIDSYRAICASI